MEKPLSAFHGRVSCATRSYAESREKKEERKRRKERWKDQGKGLSPADLNLKTPNIFSRV